ncbi:ORC1-type DNA replication protein [Candidatus Woesearchaeota archaeon]|nr:ORC1-type DNA replication protein [Candidatus Woesearchaeota archaeon]
MIFHLHRLTRKLKGNPENIPHREEQIEQIAKILAPTLKLNKPSNVFIYGKTGTGKTLSVKHTTNKIKQLAEKMQIPISVVYLNCKLKKVADTEYRLIAQIIREFGKEIPPTGLPTDEVYKIFFNTIDSRKQIVLLILDEIDQLVKKTGDEILYNLTRINSETKESQISLIGISNDLVFTDTLDPRIKSSLSEEEIIFKPYNALQIQEILLQRSKMAFKKEAISQGVIEKCAAYAAREHGDARRALELLRVAGEIADREGCEKLEIKHLDEAEEKVERDRIVDIVLTQPKQFQATLYSIILLSSKKKTIVETGELYNLYRKICTETTIRPLTQRRVSDVVSELDMLGIINARVISKGRYGRTREISLAINAETESKIKTIIEKDLGY